jgi:hypothetical protein
MHERWARRYWLIKEPFYVIIQLSLDALLLISYEAKFITIAPTSGRYEQRTPEIFWLQDMREYAYVVIGIIWTIWRAVLDDRQNWHFWVSFHYGIKLVRSPHGWINVFFLWPKCAQILNTLFSHMITLGLMKLAKSTWAVYTKEGRAIAALPSPGHRIALSRNRN